MKIRFYFLMILPSMFLLNSCGLYRQNVVNVPLFEKKGQAQVGGHLSFTGKNLQLGYSVTNHFGVVANYNSYYHKETNGDVKFQRFTNEFKEIGAGYFRKSSDKFYFDVFFLAGNGNSKRDRIYSRRYSFKSINYNRFAIQTDFRIYDGPVEFAISPRIFMLYRGNYRQTYDETPYSNLGKISYWGEVAVTTKFRIFKFLKIVVQSGLTAPTSFANYAFLETSPFNFSVGTILNFNLIKDKTK